MKMNIVTHYIHKHNVVKINRALNPNSAILRCVNNMQTNFYGADVAQVFNEDTAQLYAEIIRQKDNSIRISYRYDPRDYKDPIRSTVLALIPQELLK